MDSAEFSVLLRDCRLEILNRIIKNEMSSVEYQGILSNLNSISDFRFKDHALHDKIPNLSRLTNEDITSFLITEIKKFYLNDKNEYNRICVEGQYNLWRNVFECAQNLIAIKKSMQTLNFTIRKDDYFDSCEITGQYLSLLADSFKEMVFFEKKMGVDRYLATSGLKNDINLLHQLLREIRDLCNEKLEEFIKVFRIQWNLTNVSKAIKDSFKQTSPNNELSSFMSTNNKKIIFLLMDGFGYVQYLWSLGGLKKRKSTTYDLNLFEWLKNFEEYQDKFILSSTLVTDTGSALATIFSGKMPSDTGIISSNQVLDGRIKDIKRIRGQEFLKHVQKYPDSFLEELDGIKVSIYDGSGFVEYRNDESFSGLIYNNYVKEPIKPQERIFKKIANGIDNDQRELIVGYVPLIDRTGHPIGAFTSFEAYEYEKLNILLVEFLLDLALNKKEIFDGKTKIIISADHGMFETSSKYISLEDLKKGFYYHQLKPPMIVFNNRSLIIYYINKKDLNRYKNALHDILNNKGIKHEIYSIYDDYSKDFFWKSPNTKSSPQLIVLFKGDGIAIKHNIDEILLHNGGHGGCSCEEVFVPFITIQLTPNLHSELIKHFAKLK